MDDLTAFVKARLDEDELAARNAGGETWDFTGVNCEVRVRERKGYGEFGRVIAYTRHGNPVEEDLALAVHIGNNDPARVLREVAAKRAIVRWHPSEPMGNIDASRCPQCELTWPCPTIRVLAAVWSDHPDYRQEWAPDRALPDHGGHQPHLPRPPAHRAPLGRRGQVAAHRHRARPLQPRRRAAVLRGEAQPDHAAPCRQVRRQPWIRLRTTP